MYGLKDPSGSQLPSDPIRTVEPASLETRAQEAPSDAVQRLAYDACHTESTKPVGHSGRRLWMPVLRRLQFPTSVPTEIAD